MDAGKTKNKVSILHRKIYEKILETTVDGTLSYRDFNLIASWSFHLKKHESKELIKEFVELGLLQKGKHGVKILKPLIYINRDDITC